MGYLKLMHTSKIEPMHLQVIYKILWSYKHDNLFLFCENSHNICCVHSLQLSNLLKYSLFSCGELGWEELGRVVTINMKKLRKKMFTGNVLEMNCWQSEAVLELEFSCLNCRHRPPFAMPTPAWDLPSVAHGKRTVGSPHPSNLPREAVTGQVLPQRKLQ